MSDRVTFTSRAGTTVDGALALPDGNGPAGAVIVLQEYWGLNGHILGIVDRFAAEGFVAVAPDLYHGKIARDSAEAGAMMQGLDWGRAIGEIAGAVEYARAHPRSSGNVAVTGFCLGGALSFASAAGIEGLACVVPWYGIPPKVDTARITAPICAHFASRDDWAKPALAEAVRDELAAAGKAMQLHIYEADHAFFNDTRPEVYSPEHATLAWQRTIEFLREHNR